MNGYLITEQNFTAGEEAFIESFSLENDFGVIFEDDEETGYLYAVTRDSAKEEINILDAVHIYESSGPPTKGMTIHLKVFWSKDWLKCALVINNHCHAVFDFENHGGYNRNEFPPPNEIWTKGERKLTDEMLAQLFK